MEIFNQQRMDRCSEIMRSILNNWLRTKSLSYTVRATDSVQGISLDEMRTRYFAVGVGENLTEIPFTDMLVVFSMLAQQHAGLKKREYKPNEDFSINMEITTDWPDDEAVKLLSQIQIETPHDTGKFLRIVADDSPPDQSPDDQQTE